MKPTPNSISQYHVVLASPGDVAVERQAVRKFFEDYNLSTAHIWKARFEVLDWENHTTIGVGRPQQLINQQTLDKYRDSLALVIGVMGQRFGSPSGKAESGTEEEFNWAMESHETSGFPEIKWFFRKVDKLDVFGVEVRTHILHRMVHYQLNKRRSGNHKTKGISEVSGTGKKPYGQKGTGRARIGTRRAPQYVGGATIFGPVVRSHATELPKKQRVLALKTALSAKAASGKLVILDNAVAAAAKTKRWLPK